MHIMKTATRLLALCVLALLVIGVNNGLLAQSGYKQTKPLDLANFDTTVSPCVDFYRFSNGGWLDKNPVPPAYSNWGSMSELAERNNEILHAILDEAAAKTGTKKGSAYQLVGDFYASGMDSAKIESDGLKPLTNEFAGINAIKNIGDLQAALARFHLAIGNPLFQTSSQQDFKKSDEVIVSIDQAGLTLPDRDYYIDQSDRFKSIRQEFDRYMVKMFVLLGDDQAIAEKNAKTVMNIESRLAKASMEREQLRDPHAVYHKMTVAQLKKIVPALNWDRYLNDMNLHVRDLNVSQPSFLKEVNVMLKSVPIKDWKTYLRWQLIDESAPFLSQKFVDTRFAFHGTVLNGQKVLQPRWKRVLQNVDNLVGEALGQMYTERTFTPQAKERALTMVKNLQAAFRDRLASIEWMSDATRAKAREKIDAFDLKIGYPDKWRSYDGLVVSRDSYAQNALRANEFETRRQLAKVGKPVDRTEWFMTPSTVNAYYNPLMNEIVFPAGILQPPFFDPNADDAVNYGGMGAVIGHEITHGFDDQGRQFDFKGNLTDWWTKEDGERFEKLAKVVEEQFDGYVAIDTLKVNGKFTLGENIADLGGLAIAYHALQKVLDQKPMLQKIDGFTPQQRFFLAWGQMWRRNYTDANLRQRLVVDPHSPSKFRSNGPLSNMKEFFSAFECGATNSMVRPAELQVKIW